MRQIGWVEEGRLVEVSALPVRRTLKRSALRAPPSTAGTICTELVGRKPWTTDLSRIVSGTAFQTMFASASSSWHWTSPRCRRGNWPCASPTPQTILPRSIARFSVSVPSHHSLSSAAFTTNIVDSNFWYTQGVERQTKAVLAYLEQHSVMPPARAC
jgi:hypothetical protein